MFQELRYRKCPKCGSTFVRTSAIHRWEDSMGKRVWLKLSLQKPFRCMDCDERFFDLRFKRRAAEPPRRAA